MICRLQEFIYLKKNQLWKTKNDFFIFVNSFFAYDIWIYKNDK